VFVRMYRRNEGGRYPPGRAEETYAREEVTMARMIACDRCGSQAPIGSREHDKWVTLSISGGEDIPEENKDICPHCKAALSQFMEPLPKAGEEKRR
jgi:hypothetical protein